MTYQPPLPLTIVGTGFGYLSGLPWVGLKPPYIVVSNDDASHGGQNPWNTGSGVLGQCQVYIADWSDTAISLMVGLPQTVVNQASVTISPYTDMGPQTFFQQAPSSNCPVSVNDNISVTVTNPQSGQFQPSLSFQVQVTGTGPF